ncbi:uncharacterized protein LODBEIA_P27050 [Lodderomyces beijingensis]|uniref:ERCC1-like central domain-containing protein n=1 Tax=Lodderomyces beijingensis TaxID=1775926 RepID=A0ABP0ZMX8_9ASCO
MSEDSSNNNSSSSNRNEDATNEIDSSSFASILAGVKRMRQEYGGDHEITVKKKQTIQQQQQQQQPSATAAVRSTTTLSASDQLQTSRPPIVNIRESRTTLDKPTAEPIPPAHPGSSDNSPQPQSKSQQEPSALQRNASDATLARSARHIHQQSRSAGPAEVLVHKSQEKNPLLSESMMKTTPWVFDSSILSDYYISPTFQILFLSLKYHKLRPEYIWTRLKKLNKGSSIVENRNDRVLRVLLVVVDIDSHQEPLRKLADFCIKHDLSLMLAWSFEEAGNYIALGKHFDNAPQKSKKSIQGFKGTDYNSSVVEALTTVKSVNKTDVSNLLANYKSVKEIVLHSCKNNEEMGNIAGLGSAKRQYLKQMFSEPFIFNRDYDK